MSEAGIWDSGDGNLLGGGDIIYCAPIYLKRVQAGMPFFERKSSEHRFQAKVAHRFERKLPDMFTF